MTQKPKLTYAVFLLILLGVIWGSGYSIARFAMTHGVPPLGYSFWQSIGPAIFLLIVCLLKEKRLPLSGPHVRYYIIAGLLGIALPNTNMYFAAPHLPAGILAVIVNTVPIMMFPLALLVRQEKFHWGRMLGVLLGVIGIMLVVGSTMNFPTGNVLHWSLVTLLTPFFFAVCALYSVYDRPKNTSSLSLATGMLVASAIMLIPLVVDTHAFYPLNSFSLPNLAVMLEIVLSSIGYVILFKLLKMAGAVYYSLVGGVVAITGLFWGWIIFNETLTLRAFVAVVLVIIALVVVTNLQGTQKKYD